MIELGKETFIHQMDGVGAWKIWTESTTEGCIPITNGNCVDFWKFGVSNRKIIGFQLTGNLGFKVGSVVKLVVSNKLSCGWRHEFK
jgi:hypothetical protein